MCSYPFFLFLSLEFVVHLECQQGASRCLNKFLAVMSSSRSDVVTKCFRSSVLPYPFFSLEFSKTQVYFECQGSFKGVFRKFQGCFKKISRSFKGVSRKFQGVSRKFQGCFTEVSRVL